MPFFDQPVPPAAPGRPPYEVEVVKQWTAEIARAGKCDGPIFGTLSAFQADSSIPEFRGSYAC